MEAPEIAESLRRIADELEERNRLEKEKIAREQAARYRKIQESLKAETARRERRPFRL